VNAVFAEWGLDRDLAGDGDTLRIRLHACPCRAVTAKHPEMVCSADLGVPRRTRADAGAPPAPLSRQPFVQPYLCLTPIIPAAAPFPVRRVPPSPVVGEQP
jgi:hypothetical protein